MIYKILTEFYFLVIRELKREEEKITIKLVQFSQLYIPSFVLVPLLRPDREELQIVENVGNLPQNTENLDFWVELEEEEGEAVKQRMSEADQQDLSQCFA